MTTEQRIDAICDFLRQRVSPELNLKKPDDDDPKRVLWVQPEVYPVYLPMPDPGKDWRAVLPCFLVMPLKDSRDRSSGLLTIRIGVMTWDPGRRITEDGETRLELDRDGWRALHATMDYVESALTSYLKIGDMEVDFPIVQSPYQEGESVPDIRPYYFGQVDVPMRYILPQRVSKSIQELLE